MIERHTAKGWIAAFEIFGRYAGDGIFPVAAEHDEIFAGPDPDTVSEEDKARLEELGWSPADVECFRRYV